jgi:hypothetical protein
MTPSSRFSKVSWAILCRVLAAKCALASLTFGALEAHAGEVTILQPPCEAFRSSGGTLILSLGQRDAESLVERLRRKPTSSFLFGGIRVVDATPEGASTVRGRGDDGSEIVIIGVASY